MKYNKQVEDKPNQLSLLLINKWLILIAKTKYNEEI
jgi:hypothetical protein